MSISLEQLNMLLQTFALLGTLALQVGVAIVAYKQFVRFKQDRLKRIRDKLTPILAKAGMFQNELARKQLEMKVMDILKEELS